MIRVGKSQRSGGTAFLVESLPGSVVVSTLNRSVTPGPRDEVVHDSSSLSPDLDNAHDPASLSPDLDNVHDSASLSPDLANLRRIHGVALLD